VSGATTRPPGARDRTTLRRALATGGVVWTLVALPLVVSVVVGGGNGAAALSVVLLGLSCGGIVASGWLLLALGLDLAAGDAPGARRLFWTAAVVVLTGFSPLLFLASGG